MHRCMVGLLAAVAVGGGIAGPLAAQQPPGPGPADPATLPGSAAVDRLAAVSAVPDAPPTPPAPPPYGGPLLERANLAGDWLGTRDAMRDHGVTWDIYSTNFYQGVTSGGLDRTFEFGGRGDILLNVNGEKAGLWKGLFIDLHAETLYGPSANNLTGALSPVSIAQILPTPNSPVTALTGVKITQALSENFVTFLGKINTVDGFAQPFTGGARGVNGFMNAGLLVPLVALRTVPYSTYGAGFAVLEGQDVVFSTMVLDSNNTPTTSGFSTFFDRGVSIISILNAPTKFFGLPGHQGIGGTYSNSKYAALDNSLPVLLAGRLAGQLPPLPQQTGSWSLFYSFDQALYVDPCDPKRSWGLFGNAGLGDGNPDPIRYSANIGVGGSSPLRSRKLDSFGVGYFYVGLSDSLKNFAPRVLPLGDEHGVELFYNAGLTPWFHITPDLQVITPVRSRVDTSVNFGLRARIDF